ncbi:MAG: 4-hydroxythreonine-4-phosphate dehydrogenase PdxA [Alphaproteobacteria bacterium]|nr:4-hydroxythreonine-4-phosphate dehydrogenase PdxA [Alphaproteobacteria bacterium]
MTILALTMGEPAGVGGELSLLAWRHLHMQGPVFFALDDPGRLRGVADGLGLSVPVREVSSPAEAAAVFAEALPVMPVALRTNSVAGRPDPANAPAVVESIDRAVALALEGAVGAIVTNPIQKATLYAAGFAHPGHTEYLAAKAGNVPVAMMLVCPELRVVPVTIHVALRDAVENLRAADIVATARVALAGLKRDFAIACPRLAIAGLNPHAGEDGAMGSEDIEIVAPALAALRAEGVAATGPMPPDTMFSPRARARYDAAICMYHDQALIPLKTLDVDGGVNVTLGLPFVRTSPDHGTALDIAGKGLADPGSLLAALRLAGTLAENRSKGESPR